MWKYLGHGESIPGVPREDIEDEEFERLSEEYDRQFPGQVGALKRCGLYKHVPDRRAPEPDKEE